MPSVSSGIRNRQVLAWSFYDFANSAYALLIAGIGYQLYFKKIVFQSGRDADFFWGLAVGLSILVAGLLGPILGALADAFGLRKRLFVVLSATAIVLTAGLALVGPGQKGQGWIIFFAANCIYNTSLGIYDSFLPHIAAQRESGVVSGFAWGLGYLGGIVCLAFAYPFLKQDLVTATASNYQITFLIVAVFYCAFSLPAFFLLKETKAVGGAARRPGGLMEAFLTPFRTLRSFRQYATLLRYVAAFFFLTEAIATSIYFMANYLSTTFGLAPKQILVFTLIVQLIGFPATWFAGHAADRMEIKPVLLASIGLWGAIILLVAFATSMPALYLACVLMGLGIGSTQAVSRSLLSVSVPTDKSAEFFGFNSLSGKLGATIGPVLFGVMSSTFQQQRAGWFSLLPFLVIATVLLLVPEKPMSGDEANKPT